MLDNRQNTIEQAQSKNPGYETDKAQTAKKIHSKSAESSQRYFLVCWHYPAGSMSRSGVRPSVCLSVCLSQHSAAARRCGRFAAVGPAGRRYRSIAAAGQQHPRRSTAHSRQCGQWHVVSWRRKICFSRFRCGRWHLRCNRTAVHWRRCKAFLPVTFRAASENDSRVSTGKISEHRRQSFDAHRLSQQY